MSTPASPSHRLDRGGRIDRDTTLTFTVDGTTYTGHPGDTVASALVAAGALRVGDSIYKRRPRGIVAAGVDEPNALIRVRGDVNESMLQATAVELTDGLEVDLLDGIGILDPREDTARYDKKHVHADVVVIGTGPAGLAAARAAAATGARVIVADQDARLGGSLLSQPRTTVEGTPAPAWADDVVAELVQQPETTLLPRTVVFGSYDNNYLLALQTVTPGPTRSADADGSATPRQRLWHITAKQVVLATGAMERPLIFANNDRPGVMLASAVRSYVGRWAALPGRRVAVFTTNDSAYDTVDDLLAAGVEVATVVDARTEASERAVAAVAAGVDVRIGSAVVDTTAAEDGARLATVTVRGLAEDGTLTGDAETIATDVLAVSGGWTPTVHLHSQRLGRLTWRDDIAGFVPTVAVPHQHLAGALNGTYDTAHAVAEGAAAGAAAATAAGFAPSAAGDREHTVPGDAERFAAAGPVRQVWVVPGQDPDAELVDHVVDLQRDNTVRDVLRATGAGMRSVEHVKRYTSISTAADQGKTSGVNTIGVIADALKAELGGDGHAPTVGEIGTTTYRAPFTPVAFAALAGRGRGDLYDPARVTSVHPWHVAHGARFEDVGQWKRPWYYPRDGEDMEAAVARECRAARTGVGFQDASTLGKIEIRGADAGEFLNRVYTNGFAKLKPGMARYGIMCRPDGMVFDDGVTLRLSEDRFVMTTTTGGAAKVLDWLEEWSQTEWPELDVTFTSVTEQWSTVAVVGPRSREVIAKLAPELDVSAEAFPFMAFRETTLASGLWARICRISFSGELAFEVNVPSWYGLAVWEQVAEAGAEFGITPYGTETMHVLRAEKGFPIVGQDTDGTVTPQDLGMDWIISKFKDFIGKRSYSRLHNADVDRKQMVSVLPVDRSTLLPEGTQLIEPGTPTDVFPVPMVGHVTSSYRSQTLERPFGLALVKGGRERIGTRLFAPVGAELIEVEVGDTVVYDPEGARRDG
ncbi:sarcosine oxidase subunit alpha [Tersicoccus solisilvae]|uniref:Sarcosine oxidase subunit alpha n=1 Tax=Tersicoccus solisilvae TaxID=1882339 RepID=A0ABQ1P9B3_9MICC|nr:2Fe-2S iron-sulfur cluster-binding protein [Tersicoccus solisilvae]GGC93496.1 sarcosine oxidase subunit alpha [Tersicoccus solisilvae]